MILKKCTSLILKACAETSVPMPQNIAPEDVMQKLSKRFITKSAGFGKMTFRKKSIFPVSHFLEMQVIDDAIFCRLRVSVFERIFATFYLLLINIISIAGLATLAIVGPADKNNVFGTIAFFFMAVFLNLSFCRLFRFMRWISGMSDPEKVLENHGISHAPNNGP